MADITPNDLMNVAPRDLKRNKDAEVKPTPLEKNAILRAQAGAMAAADAMGVSKDDQFKAAAAIGDEVRRDPDLAAKHVGSLVPDSPIEEQLAQVKAMQVADQAKATWAEGVDFFDQVGASFSELTFIPAALRALDKPAFQPDPNFDYMKNRDQYEAGLPEEDRIFLRESASQEELDWKLQELAKKRERLSIIGAHGTAAAVAAGLTGGLIDPAGWVAGLGVGKVAQLAGVGARVAYQAGNLPKAVGLAAAEGAAGNVLYESALDAAGTHVTSADYAFAAAFGAVFGQLGLIGAKMPEFDGAIKAQADEIMATAQAQNAELYAEAQARMGKDATPEQIKAEVDNIQRQRYDDVMRIALADVPEGDMVLPRYDPFAGESLPSSLADPAVRDELAARWGMGPETVEDAAERALLSEIAVRAERWNAANPVDEARLDSILAKAPWLASTGLNLARSSNPVARYIAGTLLESTAGATGRRRTAAITKALRERQYMEYAHGYEDAYKSYRGRHGGSAVQDVFGSQTRHQFDRLVAEHRENRRLGVRDEVDPAVKQAADFLDEGYNRMRLEQQKAGTIGAERLGDTSTGYAPRLLDLRWVKGASNAQRNALSRVIARQLEEQWGDADFARKIAARYIDRGIKSADGSTSMPANLHTTEGSEILRDVLADPQLGLDPEQMAKMLGRFSRGGPGHTKKRLDLDMTETLVDDDGNTFRLMDAFVQDQITLYQRYARRVSGDVALTQFGVMGDHGMRMLRRAMSFGEDGKRATPEELEAFDQIYAEFFGRPMPGTGNKFADNIRLLTSSSRLGGMAFPQVAEMANSAGLLGVKGAMKYVASLPRLISDVWNNKPSPLLESLELIGGPIGQDRRVIFPYQEPNDVRVYGRDSLNVVDRIIRGGSNALPWLNGWHHLHAAQVRGIAEQIVHKAFKYIKNGEESVALQGMGIDEDVAKALRKDLKNIAKFDKQGNLIALDLTKASDAQAANAFVQGVHRGSKQIIQGTFIGETGKWAHKDMLRILTQFRTFSITAMEKQWLRQRVDYGTAKATGLLLGAMSFAIPIHLARVNIAAMGRDDRDEYLERQLAPDMLVRATLNYASLSGGLGDILDAGAALSGYEMSGVRGGMRNLTDNIPAAGYINTAGRAVTERDPKDLIRSLPGGNLPWLVPVMNAAASD